MITDATRQPKYDLRDRVRTKDGRESTVSGVRATRTTVTYVLANNEHVSEDDLNDTNRPTRAED